MPAEGGKTIFSQKDPLNWLLYSRVSSEVMYMKAIWNRLNRLYLYVYIYNHICETMIIKEREDTSLRGVGETWEGLEEEDKEEVEGRKGKSDVIIF